MESLSYVFELLCVDKENKTVVRDVKNFVYVLLGNGSLWTNAKQKKDTEIQDNELTISVSSVKTDTNQEQDLTKAFIVRLVGSFSAVESKRLPLIDYISDIKFQPIYVITDEISEEISGKIYPGLYQVENKLRRYLINFFITKFGPNWWKLTANESMTKKVEERNKTGRVLSDKIDNDAYLIDFGDLGRIIYRQSTGYNKIDDIIKKIESAEETVDAIKKLKAETQSNYTKFFKETFKDKKFQEKWENLEQLRHKVAHNNLFTYSQLLQSEELIKSLIEIIDSADKNIGNIEFSEDEKDVIRESVAYRTITSEDLLDELAAQELRYSTTNGFVGFTKFVKNYLGGTKGYDPRQTKELIAQMKEEKIVDVYYINNEYGEHPVAAIRIHPDYKPKN